MIFKILLSIPTLLKDQPFKNHPLYAEYARMRIRERELLCEEEELRKAGVDSANFLKANRKFAISRKKLDQVEKDLRKNSLK